jgi:hypothetical protein
MDRMIIFVAKIILITTMNINEEVHKAYEVIKKAESSCILQIPSGNWMWCDKFWGCCQNIQTQTKSRKPKYDCFDEWRTHDVQRL